ncbi:MAG TPA: acyl-CoA dehydrogenase family protein [Tepidiformaceae bacterium]|nr:acyl-CoA dehydrogenase family protein [Tepidiformaceae bacterium]
MEFQDTAEEAAFRSEVRSFLAAELPKEFQDKETRSKYDFGVVPPRDNPVINQWSKALSNRGWIAPHWPKEYGGAGMSPTEQFIFNEEMAEARAPSMGGSGLNLIGPVIILYGTDEQKKEHLPKITSGEVYWCQGYSEPGSGSDLASLQTRAIRDGDDYVLNGQKIWTSGAHQADWIFALTRTDPDAPKHRGISMFVFDMKTPGVSTRPLVNMANHHEFNETFFEDVRVPAKNMIGEENRGWYVGAALLDFERSNVRGAVQLKQTVDELCEYARDHSAAIVPESRLSLRHELADRRVEADIARLFSYRIAGMQKRGQIPNYEASMNKNFSSETSQRIYRTGMKMVGMAGGTHKEPRWSALENAITDHYLTTVSSTIAAGTSEINRNVIATRGLGLPRG